MKRQIQQQVYWMSHSTLTDTQQVISKSDITASNCLADHFLIHGYSSWNAGFSHADLHPWAIMSFMFKIGYSSLRERVCEIILRFYLIAKGTILISY